MKKITLAAAAVFAAIAFSACGNSTPKADLKTDVDTLSYAMGVAQTGVTLRTFFMKEWV